MKKICHSKLSESQRIAIDNVIENNGKEKALNFFLDMRTLTTKCKSDDDYRTNALKYISSKL